MTTPVPESVPVWPARCSHDGRVQPDAPEAFQAHMRTMAGMPVEVIVQRRMERRSLDQNAYLHSEVFPRLAAHWRESVARTKLLVMGACFGWRECHLAGHWLPVQPSTSELSVQECARLIDWVIPWAADRGVEIPPPVRLSEQSHADV